MEAGNRQYDDIVPEEINRKVGISLTDSSKIIEDIFEEILISLENGNDVKLSSFGTFTVNSK